MKRLTLLRHAKSSWNNPDQTDIARPLNDRGWRDAPLMGQVCSEKIPAPDLILVSPAQRTRETIESFLEGWGLKGVRVDVDDRLYLAGIEDWYDVISERSADANHILGCAHQPGVGDFAYWLDNTYSMDVPTSAVISFSISGGELDRNCGELEFYGIPREYRE